MFKHICFCLNLFGYINTSHSDGWGEQDRSYNEQHREHLPIQHTASTSIVTTRLDRGIIDLPGVQRVGSEDSPDKTTVNVATTVDVKARCCNSNCCDDDKVFDCCC